MNIYIVFCALTFFVMENQFFGWNGKPQSAPELVCDGIVILIFALAFIGVDR